MSESLVRRGFAVLLVGAGLVLPFYADKSWLRMGLFAFAAAVAALGLSLLIGQAGQLSLGHSFFVAVGAYGYTFFASGTTSVEGNRQVGLGLPPVLAVLLAVLLAGVAGLAFSPISARLRGIYLGVASLGLVFGGLHLLNNAEPLTGGAHGRDVPSLSLFGFSFDKVRGQTLHVLGVPFGKEEKLWYLALAVTVAAYLYYRNLVRGRPGRALRAVRDRDLMAGIMGVPVRRYKAYAFVVSSMYAGLGGVLFALVLGRIVPDAFGVALAIEYLAMVVIGGAGSAAGAVAGAAFVVCLPRILDRYAESLPGIASSSSASGSGGLEPTVAAQFAYGAAVVLLLLIEPGGVAAVGRRVLRLLRLTPPQ
ncbi:MAG: branched-chain amino acid ABC transporter permease [Actinobacteria bacterium 13_2_20CM_2_71_6]|nr:MAG: branched-chain amino acid ABC transporter permease [Actinobacteria bacterium 13_2_20CM_2_71_6]